MKRAWSSSPASRAKGKFRFLFGVLLPPVRWLAAHPERPASLRLRIDYLRKRRGESRGWNRLTRRDRLLPEE